MQGSSKTGALDAPIPMIERAATQRWLLPAALLVLSALLVTRAIAFWLFTIDDAYITLRYARHLAQGFGPSWNPGAAPAEGYTTLSWMLLLSLAEFLRLDGPAIAKGSGVVFALASFASMALLLRRAGPALMVPYPAQLLGLLSLLALFVCYWPLSLHAVSGMETMLSCFVLSAFFLQSVTLRTTAPSAPVAEPASSCRWLALTGLACCLTRPEAVLPCGVTLLVHLIVDRAGRWTLLRACALWLALPFACYYVWRWQHFGLLFPLSFYVKATGRPLFTGLPDVLEFFKPFAVEQPWWSLFFLLGAVRAWPLYPSLLGALSFVIFFVFPEHIMAFEGRYLLPLFPLLAATAALGVSRSSQRLLALTQTKRSVALAAGALSLTLLAASELPRGRETRAKRWLDYGRGLNRAHVALGRDLADAKGVIALLDVGAIGYFADWHTIDTFGLNDAHVALTRRRDVAYVLTQRPDLLVVVSAEPLHYKEVFEWETPLYQAARAQDYQHLCEYEFEADYLLQVLGRPGANGARGSVCKSAARVRRDRM